MSWEWDEHEVPCPCGKGTILVMSGSDDWGREKHNEEMHCRECKRRFVYTPIPGDSVRHRFGPSGAWISRAEHERRNVAAAAEERPREEARARARARYGKALVAALAHLRSRKTVWETLREAGSIWSFASFNRLVRERGREAAIREVIDPENREKIAELIARLRSQRPRARGGRIHARPREPIRRLSGVRSPIMSFR